MHTARVPQQARVDAHAHISPEEEFAVRRDGRAGRLPREDPLKYPLRVYAVLHVDIVEHLAFTPDEAAALPGTARNASDHVGV